VKLRPDTQLRLEVAGSDGELAGIDRRGGAYLAEIEHFGERFDSVVYVRRQANDFGVGQQFSAESGQEKQGLQGRVPIHMGNGHTLGEAAGSTSVTVNIQQLPTHQHVVMASPVNASGPTGSGNYLGVATNAYVAAAALVPLSAATVSSVGGSQPHNNMMPYLVLNFIIALQGIFPSQN